MKTENFIYTFCTFLFIFKPCYPKVWWNKIGPKFKLNEMDEDKRLIRKNLNLAWHELYDHNNNVIEGMWGILMRLPTSSFPLTGQLPRPSWTMAVDRMKTLLSNCYTCSDITAVAGGWWPWPSPARGSPWGPSHSCSLPCWTAAGINKTLG